MRSKSLIQSLVMAVLILAMASVSKAQRIEPPRPGSLPPIGEDKRAAIVDSVAAIIDSVYVLGEPAAEIVVELRRALAAGEYDEITDPVLFARRLYEDCQRVNHDGHFDIYVMPPLDSAAVVSPGRVSPEDKKLRERFYKSINYGFKKAEILPGGVGYLRFDGFINGDEAFRAAIAAMNFLANSNAVILDLRHNGGGAASMIRFLCGYLFKENTHLINWEQRANNKTVQSYSADFVPGKRITEQPVYILTSRKTFSAAEEFTFDLKNLKRATVVGDTTGGGGHTVETYTFDFDDFRVGIRVPYGRAFNPITNEGWEGVGVIPDIAVPEEKALDAAYADALKNLIDGEKVERAKAVYKWALADIESRIHPVKLSKKEMKKYSGTFGPRRIIVKDGQLWYQRGDGPKYMLDPMAEDLFRVGDLKYFRLSFGRDSRGRIVKVIGLYNNGRTDENMKD